MEKRFKADFPVPDRHSLDQGFQPEIKRHFRLHCAAASRLCIFRPVDARLPSRHHLDLDTELPPSRPAPKCCIASVPAMNTDPGSTAWLKKAADAEEKIPLWRNLTESATRKI
jgi:hypothetical protein